MLEGGVGPGAGEEALIRNAGTYNRKRYSTGGLPKI